MNIPSNWYEDFCYSIFWWDFGWDNEQEEKNVIYQAEKFIETVKEALTIEVNDQSKESIVHLLKNIYAKHKVFPYKKFMVYDRFLYSSKTIKQNLLVFSEVVAKALGGWEQKTAFPWESIYTNEILHEMAVRWDNLTQQTDRLRHQVTILILSDLGLEHAKLLESILNENFREKIITMVHTDHYYDKRRSEDHLYDLYVSNYAIEHLTLGMNIIVEDIPSFKNITDLRSFINKKRLILPEEIDYLRTVT